jgi:regulator of replication initiation timing
VKRTILLFVLLTSLCVPGFARGRRDPLSEKEVDQMREVAQNGEKRLRLLLTFAQVRMLAIYQMRGDPKFAEGRGARVHDLLEDFANLITELDRNIDQYANQKQDVRKPLKEIIEANADFQLKLRGLKEAAALPANADEVKEWKYVLEDAIDAVNSNGDNARQTLEEQNELAKDKKLHKPE